MRFYLFTFLLSYHFGVAQNDDIDSLKQRLATELPDTTRVKVLARIAFEYAFVDSDTSRDFANQAIRLAESIGFLRGKADALNNIGISYDIQGNYEKSLSYILDALAIYETLGYEPGKARAFNNIAIIYYNLNDTDRSLEYHLKSFSQEKKLGDSVGIAFSMIHLGELYRQRNDLDSSLHYLSESTRILEGLRDDEGLTYAYNGLGNLFMTRNDPAEALKYFHKAYNIYNEANNKIGLIETSLLIGNTLDVWNENTEAYSYYEQAYKMAEEMGSLSLMKESAGRISSWYERNNNYREALSYFKQYSQFQDSLLNEEKFSELAKIQSDYDLLEKEKELELVKAEKESQKTLIIVFGILLTSIIAFSVAVYRNYLLKSKANKLLEKKNEEIRKKNVLIEREKKNALQATEAKAKFLSSMSHEIRTPLNAIIGITQLLNENSMADEEKENLKALRFSAENLLGMVGDILDFSKIEANKMDLEEISFDIHELLKNIKLTFQPKAADKKLNLKVTFENDVPKILIGDPGKLIQVLTNLLGNAVKFTNQGSIVLKVKVVSEPGTEVKLHFEVSDTGIGIPEKNRTSILDPFSQGASDTYRNFGGTGLGLSIVKKLLEQMGSTIQFVSEEQKGSTFFFDISYKIGDSSSKILTDYNKRANFRSLKGTKVLLAEDNKINELLVVKTLQKWDITADVASNGLQALEMVQLKNYDLVLMDIIMPEMDGINAAINIRKLKGEKFRHLPIIALTATATKEAREEVYNAGMNDYITKPFNLNDLYNKIESHLIKKDLVTFLKKDQEDG